MLELHDRTSATGAGQQSLRLPQEKELLARDTEATDAQIDRLVSPTGMIYELYGLTEAEIKIVEGG